MALNGTDVLLLANTGTVAVPVWTVVGSQRDASISESVGEIDTSSKDSPNKTVQGGRYSASISLDALYTPSDAAYSTLKAAQRARTLVQIRVNGAGVGAAAEWAYALITKLDRNFPDQGESTVSIDLAVSGGWTAI